MKHFFVRTKTFLYVQNFLYLQFVLYVQGHEQEPELQVHREEDQPRDLRPRTRVIESERDTQGALNKK